MRKHSWGNTEVLEKIKRHFNEGLRENVKESLPTDRANDHDSAEMDATTLQAIQRNLRETLAEELHMSPKLVDDEATFTDMGLDSISGVSWVRKLSKHYGLSISRVQSI